MQAHEYRLATKKLHPHEFTPGRPDAQPPRSSGDKGPFKSGPGFITQRSQDLWQEEFNLANLDGLAALTQYTADPDPKAPLYFWQLHSILGADRIEAIARRFYTIVWKGEDKEEDNWFKKAFIMHTDLESAVWSQAAFWIDAFGGGFSYHGGQPRLAYKHSRQMEVMHRQAADRWLGYMKIALDQADLGTDPRVRPCIEEFLVVHMKFYAKRFGFSMDEGKAGEEEGKQVQHSSGGGAAAAAADGFFRTRSLSESHMR